MVTLAQSSPGDRSARAPQSKTATVMLARSESSPYPMCESEAEPIPLPSATVRSNCPHCDTRLVVQRIVPGQSGLEYWTLRCTKCGHIHQDAVHSGLRDSSS